MRRWLWLALLAGVSALPGCSMVEPRPEMPPIRVDNAAPKVFNLSGRISFKQGKEGGSGSLRWTHAAPEHRITLLTPIGTTVANLVADANGVTLITSDQREFHSTDGDRLVSDVLGWSIPVNGMQYWVLARPVPDRPAEIERDAVQHVSHLVQDSWEIDYSNYRTVSWLDLPGRIVMRRGDIEVRLVIDNWKIADNNP